MKSEVLENYFQIALDQGLIEKSAAPESKDYKSGFKNRRQGSDDISTVEALYGIQPNGKEDDEHIMDKAHPSTVVIAPAFDRFNGVVENNQQRQNVMSQIALKNPNGNYNQRRYVEATKNLLDSLVRVGFLLDNKNEEKLTTLADTCSQELVKESKSYGSSIGSLFVEPSGQYGKTKLTTLSQVGLGTAAALAGVYALNHTSTFNQGTIKNLALIQQISTECLEEVPANVRSFFEKFSETASELKNVTQDLHSVEVNKESSPEEVKTHIDQIAKFKELSKSFKAQLAKLKPIIAAMEKANIGADSDEESSWQSTLALKKAYKFFVPGSKYNFLNAAETAASNLDAELQFLQAIDAAAEVKASQAESKTPESAKPTASDPFAAPSKETASPSGILDPSTTPWTFSNL